MAAPALIPSRRYYPPGTRKCYFVPALANYNLPTRTELNAGTDLSAEIASGGVAGWSLQGATVDVPDMGSRYTSTIPARLTSPTNTIDIYLDSGGIDVRTLLPRDTTGFIVWFWEGDFAGGLMDVWPIRVITQAIDTNTEDPGKVSVEFAITKIPSINVKIPA